MHRALHYKENFFFKSSARLEPLVWGWYAWPQLISPTTASLNIVNRNIKLMESFISMPEIHQAAAAKPSLLGGSFINLNESHVPVIQELVDKTKQDCRDLIVLAQAINECDEMLRSKVDGHSLEDLYPLVPHPLKGRVELVYDANNQPAIRFIEPLIYDKYYCETHQALLMSDTICDYRPFVLSTPRIIEQNELKLNMPFSDKRIDVLARLRFNAMPLSEIYDFLELAAADQLKLFNFLTPDKQLQSKDRNFMIKG